MDTMKKIYYIILGLLVGLVACQENDKTDFDSNGAVYFQVNQGSWSDTRDSIVYSFAGKDGDSQTLNVQVNLMGGNVMFRLLLIRERRRLKKGYIMRRWRKSIFFRRRLLV